MHEGYFGGFTPDQLNQMPDAVRLSIIADDFKATLNDMLQTPQMKFALRYAAAVGEIIGGVAMMANPAVPGVSQAAGFIVTLHGVDSLQAVLRSAAEMEDIPTFTYQRTKEFAKWMGAGNPDAVAFLVDTGVPTVLMGAEGVLQLNKVVKAAAEGGEVAAVVTGVGGRGAVREGEVLIGEGGALRPKVPYEAEPGFVGPPRPTAGVGGMAIVGPELPKNPFLKNAPNIPPKPGYFDLVGHSSHKGTQFLGEVTGIDVPEVLGMDEIRRQLVARGWKGQPIRLISCNAGNPELGANAIGYKVSEEFGVVVEAPASDITVFENGSYVIAPGEAKSPLDPSIPNPWTTYGKK
jgi:hypothetical protein